LRRNFIADNKQGRMNLLSRGRSLETKIGDDEGEEEEVVDDGWKHHYAHRDRRDLYKLIQTKSPW
jgi:hypothetical protein